MWITLAAGLYRVPAPSRHDLYRPAVRASAAAPGNHAQGVHDPERAAPAGQTGCPATSQDAIAIALMPRHLRAPDNGHPP